MLKATFGNWIKRRELLTFLIILLTLIMSATVPLVNFVLDSHTVKLMSGRKIPATKLVKQLFYHLVLRKFFRSFILSFDKSIFWMEPIYWSWSTFSIKSEFCFYPIPIYVNALISSGLKQKTFFNIVMTVSLKCWLPHHIILSTWHAKIPISVLFSLQ